ncbi:hypothetical protein [Bacillus thuringiensis]|uniref:hypothetical protein n=1 Tax=Bacillus thuringiensis TaxID=1428 RepID=UPI0008936CDE|nr:hypothetical protein [Bacillus thuringiensis]OFC75871.1 hypothetical protein BTGOE1_35860 [Bacillus thuringiensis]OFC84840.1 hypothetical protein BTGOE2_10370 [Bacillus thuringiensis]
MNKFVCVKCSELWESTEAARDGVRCDKCKGNNKVIKPESTYLWLDVLKKQLIADVADNKMINAVDHAQVIIREKVTGYADERTTLIKSACNNKTTVTELPERYRGIKLSETSLNIRNEIIQNDINYLKDITPEQMELLVQLFEKENKRKANLSNYSTSDLIEDLRIREDVHVAKTDAEVYKVEIDLFKAKKYTIVENNCDMELVKRRRASLDEELRIFAGQ